MSPARAPLPPESPLPSTRERLRTTARDAFGWKQLRPGQLEAMESVMAGEDTLVVMPTGSGKSASTRCRRCCWTARPWWSRR